MSLVLGHCWVGEAIGGAGMLLPAWGRCRGGPGTAHSAHKHQQSGPTLIWQRPHLYYGPSAQVWDLGSRNKDVAVPRALWYGLEFVRYTLYR